MIGIRESSSCMKSDMTDRSLMRIISIDRWRTSYSASISQDSPSAASNSMQLLLVLLYVEEKQNLSESLQLSVSLINHKYYVIAVVLSNRIRIGKIYLVPRCPNDLEAFTAAWHATNLIDYFFQDIKLAATYILQTTVSGWKKNSVFQFIVKQMYSDHAIQFFSFNVPIALTEVTISNGECCLIFIFSEVL